MAYTDLSGAFGYQERLTSAQASQLRDNSIAIFDQTSGGPQAIAVSKILSYTGDNASSRFIDGINFDPCLIMIINMTTPSITFKTITMPDTYSIQLGTTGPHTSDRGIQTIANQGFRVRYIDSGYAMASCNKSGDIYHVVAYKSYSSSTVGSQTDHAWTVLTDFANSGDITPSSAFQSLRDSMEAIAEQASGSPSLPVILNGTYTGNGSSHQHITGLPYQSQVGMVFSNPTSYYVETGGNASYRNLAAIKSNSFPNCLSVFLYRELPTSYYKWSNNCIKTLTGSGFIVGQMDENDICVNSNGATYHYVMFKGTS